MLEHLSSAPVCDQKNRKGVEFGSRTIPLVWICGTTCSWGKGDAYHLLSLPVQLVIRASNTAEISGTAPCLPIILPCIQNSNSMSILARTFTVLIMAMMVTAVTAQRVGIETETPDSTLSISNKVEIGGAEGDIVFTDDLASIKFPATSAPNSPMLYMFGSGINNADRMVLAHSPQYSNYGIMYKDEGDEFHFMGAGQHTLSIGMLPSNKRMALADASIVDGYTFNVDSDDDTRVINIVNNTETSSISYGVYSRAMGTGEGGKQAGFFSSQGGSGLNIGVLATAASSSEGNTALYAMAFGNNARAAQFEYGDVIVKEDLIIGSETAAAGYKLSVNGKVISEELRIQDSGDWPDYVFADDYYLMPLDDLEAAINQQNHLPGIPSAAVVESEGILVGDMQKLTMEKVEELTLYVIELNKQNEMLREEIEELKVAIKSNK